MSSGVFVSVLFLLLSVSDSGSCESELDAVLEPYDLLFDNAVEAYYKQDWLSVILNMERALKNKGTVRKVKAQCRLSCANLTSFQHTDPGSPVPLPGAGPVQDLGFFQRVLKRAECVNRCEAEKLGPPSVHKISDEVELEFRKRTPYNYLQVAYFKINKLDKAVAAANTFYIANPDHMEMRQNLEYYSMMAGVQETDFKDLEARPHMAEFLEGKRLYSGDDFSSSIAHFEAALEEFFVADAECRALCEGEYDYDGYNYMEYNADLFQSISGEQYEKAIECAKTFLLFRPDDQVMKQNLEYYSAVLGEDKAAAITAREVVEQYIKKSLLEKELLYFGYEIFGITFVDPDSWTPEEIMPKKLRDKQKADRETAARITEEIGNLMKEIETLVEEKSKESSDITKIINDGSQEIPSPDGGGVSLFDGITVSMAAEALNGSLRTVLDGAITDDECRELHRLSNTAAQKGDGYRGRPSPHSPSEMFQGVTVLKALKLGQEGVLPLKSARLFFDISEKVRRVVESYFSLQSPLYFSYSHLVCRSAIEEKQEDREDLSHPVHVDNCLLISELNECVKEPPAYTHRDYSAILYLNDDFEGGDFIFTELDAKTVTERIQADELLKMLSSPLDAEFQRSEEDKDKTEEMKSEKDSVKPDGEKNAAAEETKTPAEDKASKTTEKADADAKTEITADAKTEITADAKTEITADAKTEITADAKTEITADAKTEITADAMTEITADAKTDTSADAKTDTSADAKTDTSADAKTDKKTTVKTVTKTKPAGKTKTKTKKAEKTKSKTDIKEKPTAKKTPKTPSKKTDGKQPKAKSSKSDSLKKKEEL
ncbi:Prolyl 3-hydroxylase 1 [Bagarius yarrelli]|uniref:procollagen-proline 3-dioxygenase n=1 Tax=Bagarius yarrelli TaxID=175774 RepID=A0A556V4P0_BAGYA|nr:Prolyl 3-hydroxylase 1 [Bagarius yarrelli]